MRYVKSALKTLWRKKWSLIAITLCGMLMFTAAGYLKAKKDITGEAERREKIDTYLSQVEAYRTAVEDSKRAVREAEEQYAALEEYTENAVYMKLDSDNAWVGSVQYAVLQEESADLENILNALNLYVTQGGMKEDIGDAHEELGVRYWGEVIGVAIVGNTFSVTITQSSGDYAKRSIEIMKERLEAYAPSVAKSYGKFVLKEQGTSVYKVSDLTIANTQNARRDQLKSYDLNHSDLETRVFNQQNTLDGYIESNRPDSLEVEVASMKKTVVLFAVVGLLIGFWIALGIVLIDYIAGNRVKSEGDVRKFQLEILGMNERKKGFLPDAAKTAVDIRGLLDHKELLPPAEASEKDGVVLYDLSRSDDTACVCEAYLDAMKEINCPASYVAAADNGADSLLELLTRGSAVLVASAGDTRIESIEEALRKLSHYGIRCLGAIVLK